MSYMDCARLEGYDLIFTDLGMAYIQYKTIKLTETMDQEAAELIMKKIGLAISTDWTRQYIENEG